MILACLPADLGAQQPVPNDSRLRPHRDLYDKYHPWTPPKTLEDWEQESEKIRRQVRLACGLWPMPEKPPLEPVIHGALDRGDYTVEKVFFASRPGLYVTGSLFRPKRRRERMPGILSPHGHWPEGRFYDAGEEQAGKQIASGAEERLSAARFPLQARAVQLARMGCVVFHYDMIGYGDHTAIPHREGFNDAEAALWMHNKMGLQTWNSIRALDFLELLPDVDPERLAVTGASGGGTQTFVLSAIDPRVAASFPAVMVSTAMQGGCVCENASFLRQDVNNIAIAALFAPRPLALSGADDWTIDIESKGLPELKQVYSLYHRAENVHAQAFPQFKHNYNLLARRMMYHWFNEHLGLGHRTPIEEGDFEPLSPREMTVFDDDHPRPEDELSAPELRRDLVERDRGAFEDLLAGGDQEYRGLIGEAARVMLRPEQPEASFVSTRTERVPGEVKYEIRTGTTTTHGSGIQVPTVVLSPDGRETAEVVFWFDGAGTRHLSDDEGELTAAVQRMLQSGKTVVSADLFLTGEYVAEEDPFEYAVDEKYPGFTFGYNRPLLTERVRDILAVLEAVGHSRKGDDRMLIGSGAAGVWVLLARGLLPEEAVGETRVDLEGFSFARIESADHPNMLPGALKYGGLGGLSALAYPAQLTLYGVNEENSVELQPLTRIYRDHPDKLRIHPEKLSLPD